MRGAFHSRVMMAAMLVLSLALTGCVTSKKYRLAKMNTPPAQLLDWESSAAPASLRLQHVIIYNKNRRKVHVEFERRRLVLPVSMAPGTKMAGSLFFPMAPGPQRLVLIGRAGDAPIELSLDLEPLAGLHLKPKKARK